MAEAIQFDKLLIKKFNIMKQINFERVKINSLNTYFGGKKDTTWNSSATGACYKDIEYGDKELNETSGTGCNGGTDKTFNPC